MVESRLAEELARVKATSPMPPEVDEKIARMIAGLERDQVAGDLLVAGDVAPALAFDLGGSDWRLDEAVRSGPVVLVFYRGPWCPYCNVHLRSFAARAEEIGALGGRVVAASPLRPDDSANAEELAALPITVVTDPGLRAAGALGLTFDLPDDISEAYRGMGFDLEEMTGVSPPRLTIPGTFVIGPGRRVHFSHADVNYRRRVEPETVIAALREVSPGA